MLIKQLSLRTPIAGFNGGIFVRPDMTVIAEHVLAAEVAKRTMEIILGLVALENGLINEKVFVSLVIMALVTSMSSGPLMKKVLGVTKV